MNISTATPQQIEASNKRILKRELDRVFKTKTLDIGYTFDEVAMHRKWLKDAERAHQNAIKPMYELSEHLDFISRQEIKDLFCFTLGLAQTAGLSVSSSARNSFWRGCDFRNDDNKCLFGFCINKKSLLFWVSGEIRDAVHTFEALKEQLPNAYIANKNESGWHVSIKTIEDARKFWQYITTPSTKSAGTTEVVHEEDMVETDGAESYYQSFVPTQEDDDDAGEESYVYEPAVAFRTPSQGDWIVNGGSGSVLFKAGTEFRMEYKGQYHFGTVKNGCLVLNDKEFKSPSRAANSISARSENGWAVWECTVPGEATWQSIAAVRTAQGVTPILKTRT